MTVKASKIDDIEAADVSYRRLAHKASAHFDDGAEDGDGGSPKKVCEQVPLTTWCQMAVEAEQDAAQQCAS